MCSCGAHRPNSAWSANRGPAHGLFDLFGGFVSAELAYPDGVAVDGLGNIYVADSWNNRIRKVDPAGVITTVAGTGVSGFSGDDGAGTSAELASPRGVAVDGLGNVYLGYGGRIRKVDPAGVITTVAGQVDPEGMGPAMQARLADPRGFVVATAFTLVAGGTTGTVQALRTSGLEVVAGKYPQSITTGDLARFRDTSFGTIAGLAYDDAASTIYLTESSNHRIHVVTVVDPDDRNTWTIASLANADGTAGFVDGSAATARFREPTGLYLDAAAHQLYVADTGNHVIRAIDLQTQMVRTIAGSPAKRGYFGNGVAATAALLYEPRASTRCGNGDLFVADTGNHRVRRIAAGTITTVLGVGLAGSSGEGGPASTSPSTPRWASRATPSETCS